MYKVELGPFPHAFDVRVDKVSENAIRLNEWPDHLYAGRYIKLDWGKVPVEHLPTLRRWS